MFKTGQTIKIKRAAHAYTMAGITDPNCIIPEEVKVMKIVRVSKTKNGVKLQLRGSDIGYGLLVDTFLSRPGNSVEVVG